MGAFMMKGRVAVSGAFLIMWFLIGYSGPNRADEGGCIQDVNGELVCPPVGGACLQDINLEVACSPPDGGIIRLHSGRLVCGRGHCVLDPDNADAAFCSKVKRGTAGIDMDSRAKCFGGCVRGSEAKCLKPKKRR
jgi:hypothetical protein